jgi:hypothetical protein
MPLRDSSALDFWCCLLCKAVRSDVPFLMPSSLSCLMLGILKVRLETIAQLRPSQLVIGSNCLFSKVGRFSLVNRKSIARCTVLGIQLKKREVELSKGSLTGLSLVEFPKNCKQFDNSIQTA